MALKSWCDTGKILRIAKIGDYVENLMSFVLELLYVALDKIFIKVWENIQ